MFLAERVGFEPTERFPVHSISSAANSTTLAPLPKQGKSKKVKGKSQNQHFLPFYFSLLTCYWRRGWDLNPRWSFPHSGFRDRCTKPLCDLSVIKAKGKSKKAKIRTSARVHAGWPG